MPRRTCATSTRSGRGSTNGWRARGGRNWRRPASTSCPTGRGSTSPAGRRSISSRMSELADRERKAKRSWARPGGPHDYLVGIMKIALPVAVGLLLAYVFLSPLSKTKEVSFLLDKNKVEVAKERMKVQSAQYRGLDDKGRPFTVNADHALQPSSNDPVVQISGMSAQIALPEG